MKKLYFALAIIVAGMVPGVAMACPSFEESGYEIYTDGGELYSPDSWTVVAGGSVELGGKECSANALGVEAFGFVAGTPDFTVYIEDLDNFALEFRVDGDCDSTLLVNDSEAVYHFNDDDDGNLDPRIRLSQPSDGRYDVWIGTYESELCDATLYIETF